MAWTAVALSDDLAAGDVAGTRLGGAEIVLWRDAAGIAHAWEDRCPHRGMRLSFGFARGDRLACLYHGWQFNGQGRCRAIPAHPELSPPSTIAVARHHCQEAAGMVWVAAQAQPPPPDMPAWPVLSLYLDMPVSQGPPWQETIAGTRLLIAPQPRSATQSAWHVVALEQPLDAAGLRAALHARRRSLEAAP
ncbi:MAG: Rieske (2Fe-2S) protein [Alphaproteobacteria bacterium]|nr:Rieske (2Fe-2S) protein [Alphaproteobacteria bacterium]